VSAFGGFEKTNLLPNLPNHGETTFLAPPLKAKKSAGGGSYSSTEQSNPPTPPPKLGFSGITLEDHKKESPKKNL